MNEKIDTVSSKWLSVVPISELIYELNKKTTSELHGLRIRLVYLMFTG